jgi:hypothetical protein
MELGFASLVRAIGTATAVALPDGTPHVRSAQALIAGASYSASWRIDPQGLQFVSLSLDESSPLWEKVASEAMGVTSWLVVNLAVMSAVRRLPVPRLLAGGVYGGLVYVADTAVAAHFAQIVAKAKAASG